MALKERLQIIIFVLTTLVWLSCTKNRNSTPNCDPLPLEPDFGWAYSYEGAQSSMPCFNPNSDEEFLYVRVLPDGSEVRIHNLALNKSTLVLKDKFVFPPKWGKNGWILLNLMDNNIWKIKPNGDSITNITSGTGDLFGPNWNFSCTGISAYLSTVGAVLLNINGKVIDTFRGTPVSHPFNYLDDDHLLSFWESIGAYSIADDTFRPMAPCDKPTCSGGVSINGNEFIWSDKTGIYRSNTISGETELLKATCDSKIYFYPTVNHSRTRLLWSTLERVPSGNGNSLKIYRKIVSMDINGDNEHVVELPL